MPKERISRREFLRNAWDRTKWYIPGAAAFGSAINLPAYGQEFAPLEKRKVDPRKRQAIIYSNFKETQDEASKALLAVTTTAVPATVAKNYKRLKKAEISRRRFLFDSGIAGGVLSIGLSGARGQSGYTDEMHRAFPNLVEDLHTAGYHITTVNNAEDLERALMNANVRRDDDAKTIVVVHAHGYMENGVSYIHTDHGKTPISVNMIASNVQSIPGHTLIVSPSCNFDPSGFYKPISVSPKYLNKENFSVVSLNAGDATRTSLGGQPFYTSIREGLRKKDVIEGIRGAVKKWEQRTPFMTRIGAAIFGSKVNIISHKPFEL